jgi:hypothetical protein
MWPQEEFVNQNKLSGCRDERKVCVHMSSDRRDPGGNWQDPRKADPSWQQLPEQFPDIEEDANSSNANPEDVGGSFAYAPPLAEFPDGNADYDEGSASNESASSTFEFIKHVSQYITLFVIPLFFCILTCLIVLPQIAAGSSTIPPLGFWPILLVIIAITVVQAVSVYYAGSENGVWILGTIGGFCLFVVLSCFVLYGVIPGILVLIALVAISVFLLRHSIHPVHEGIVDIVYSFKKYNRTCTPGINILLPWEEVAIQLNVEEIQWICPAQIIQLSREEDVMLRGVISYQLVQEDAHLAITQIQNWESSLRNLFQTTLQTISTVFKPDDFLIWPHGRQTESTQPGDDDFTGGFERRNQINNYLFQLMRDKAALWGVQINWVSVRDIEVAPHGSIKIEPIQMPVHVTAAPRLEQPVPQPVKPVIQTVKLATNVGHAAPVSAPSSGTAPTYALSEEVLARAYQEVKNGKITDPETIRSIASRFETVAQHPELSQSVSFDAARAALNLYEQARLQEQPFTPTMYHDDTQPELVIGTQKDEGR